MNLVSSTLFALRVAWWSIRLSVRVMLLCLEGLCWVLLGLRELGIYLLDAGRASKLLDDGELHCSRGHVIPTENLFVECRACGFRYEGSILECANPECGATTPFLNCPTCSESVRNPFRYGRR